MSATRTHSVHTKQRLPRHHISQQPMNPTAPTVVVADLTSSIGLHALMQLGVHQPTSRGFWSQIVLADVPHAPRIDWLRPNQPEELDSLHASPAAVALIVGPGSVHLLRKVLAHATIGQAATVWFFCYPTRCWKKSPCVLCLSTAPYRLAFFSCPTVRLKPSGSS